MAPSETRNPTASGPDQEIAQNIFNEESA